MGSHLPHLTLGMEDVPATRDSRPGLCLPGAQALASVGHCVLEAKPTLGEREEMNSPGDSVAVRLLREKVAVG